MIWTAETIRQRRPLSPFIEKTTSHGLSGGLSACGYDIHIAQDVHIWRGQFVLASSVERFDMPTDCVAVVHDKSTWARRGLAVQNTVIEPGWRGYLTLELTLHADVPLQINEGSPIAQVLFHQLDGHVPAYRGKYDDQPNRPVGAIMEPGA